jgi:hypothetical protein
VAKAAETDAQRDVRFREQIKRSLVRCDCCPVDDTGYPPVAEYKFHIYGDDFEGRDTITVYQCPVCKTIVVTGQ